MNVQPTFGLLKKKYFCLGGHFCQYKQYDTLAQHSKLHILVKITNGFWLIWSYSISCPLCYWTDGVSCPPSSTDHGGSYSSFNPDSGYESIPLILLTFLQPWGFQSLWDYYSYVAFGRSVTSISFNSRM